MEDSKQVFRLCDAGYGGYKSLELEAFLEAHADVDLNYIGRDNMRALHCTMAHGNVKNTRLLVDARADLEVRNSAGQTALQMASLTGDLECLQLLIENKADTRTVQDNGYAPPHGAAYGGHHESLNLLIHAQADVNARTGQDSTSAMLACGEDRLTCLQLLLDAKCDLGVKRDDEISIVFCAMAIPRDQTVHRVPGMPFAVLSCNTDSKNAHGNLGITMVTSATVDTHIDEYKQIHDFIDKNLDVTEYALSADAVVDTRVGRGDYGLYHEPLEQVLLYLGLSMKKDQTVNVSIDGKSGVKRALMPGHPTNANLWYELYQRTHCSSCSTRSSKLKKCTCFTARYCNIDCQRRHWQTHKPGHRAVMS
jgi:hypothetical protein